MLYARSVRLVQRHERQEAEAVAGSRPREARSIALPEVQTGRYFGNF